MASLTADQAAFMLHTLGLPALRAERGMTSAVIAAIPPGRADYRPMATRAAALTSRGTSSRPKSSIWTRSRQEASRLN